MPLIADVFSLATGGNMPSCEISWGRTMHFDLHRPIEEGHKAKSERQLQKQILKVLTHATPTDASRRGTWRLFGAGHSKGSLRFLTAWDPEAPPPRRTQSWRSNRAVRLRNFEDNLDTTDRGGRPHFKIIEAEFLDGLKRQYTSESASRGKTLLADRPKYLAISYRWPNRPRARRVNCGPLTFTFRERKPAKRDESQHCYDVVDPRANGGRRKNHAPKEVIDRAVAFAKDRDIQLIWIDQECINQSDREDKECGIRSMDDIFLNAEKVLGLLKVHLNSPLEVEALHWLSEGEPLISLDLYRAAVRTVHKIASDEWFSRAWCFQEAVSGGNTLEFSILCDPKSKEQAYNGDTEEWGGVANEIQFQTGHVAKWLTGLYAHAAFFDQNPPPGLSADEQEELWQMIMEIRNSLVDDFPPYHEPTHLSRPRLTCNAAAALMFLKRRDNSRGTDRVSILASLGNYSRKLNTLNIHKFSMSSCVLAQSLLNGDLSLLTGVPKEVWRERRLSRAFSWLPPTTLTLQDLEAHHEGHPSLRLSEHSITKQGLHLPGFYWTVDQPLDVHSIRQRYYQEWTETIHTKIQEEVPSILRKISKDARKGTGEFFDRLFDASEKYCNRDIHHLHDERAASRQSLGSRILGDLLCHLVENGHLKIANAIWHSVRRKTPLLSSEEMENSTHTHHSDRSTSSDVPGSWFNKNHSLGRLPHTLDPFVKNGRLQIPCLDDQSRVSRLFIPMRDNWDWLVHSIMDDGVLWSGQPSAAAHSDHKEDSACCIFDVDSKCLILTPHCGDEMEKMEDSGRLIAQSLPLMRNKRISWILEPLDPAPPKSLWRFLLRKGATNSHKPGTRRRSWLPNVDLREPNRYRFATKGMVAGVWRRGNLSPVKVTLV